MFFDPPEKHDGIYEECVSHDELFANLTFEPVIANFMDVETLEGKEKLNKLLYSRYEGDSLNVVPCCDCGALYGADHLEEVCVECGTTCAYITEKALESLLWIKAPDKINCLINPTAWIILSNAYTTSGFNLLEWLTDSSYQPPPKTVIKMERMLEKYKSYGYERGLNSFYENFDNIIAGLYSSKLVKDYGPNKDTIQTWIKENRSKIFSQYLPIPSKVSFVVESSGTTTFVDKKITLAFDAVHAMIAIENSSIPLSIKRKESKVVKAIKTLSEYYREFSRDTLGAKPGIFRKHVFGGSLYFTARAVISSIPGPHNYDELYLPWTLSLQLFSLHITNKLSKYPYFYTPNQINDLLRDYALKHNPLLERILNDLIKDSPYGRIPFVFQRNPSLVRGSAQLLWCPKIKTDPRDTTISWSPMVFKAANADCDGDEMNLKLVEDMYTFRRLSRLEPHLYALDLNKTRTISGYLKLPGPIVTTLANWLYKRK